MGSSNARRPLTAALIILAFSSLTACSVAGETPAGHGAPLAHDVGAAHTTAPKPTAAAPPVHSDYPVVLDNCGFDLTVTAPPRRVVTIKSTSLELMLALGLENLIVGTAFRDGPVPELWADAARELPVIADQVPGMEATLSLQPDLIYAGWESNFSAEGVGDRQTLAQLGVASYVAASACKGEGYMPDPMTFELLFDEFREVGSIFGVQDRAAALIAEQQNRLDRVQPNDDGLSAIWFSSGKATPYVGAGLGAPQMIMEAAGLNNVAGAVPDSWTSISWEAVLDAAPDVFVLVDAQWNTADSKIEFLKEHPVVSALPAVQHDRFIIVPFPASEAGVRSVEAVESIVEQLETLTLP